MIDVPREPKPSDSDVSWDVYYKGEQGFGEHFRVSGPDSKPILAGRTELLNWLKSTGAKALPRDVGYDTPKPAAAPSRPPFSPSPPDPMMVAAQQVLGASVGRTCPIHNAAMKRIPGTQETGKVSRNGKSYPSFWVCEAAEGCRGE